MQFIPLLCYYFRWNIEVSYYEQKTFWSLCSYMVRSSKGIEMLVNLINVKLIDTAFLRGIWKLYIFSISLDFFAL